MDEVPVTGREEDNLFRTFLGSYDSPAYIRRALQVEHAFGALLEQCALKRAKMLEMARLRLGVLRSLAGDWQALRPLVKDERQLKVLEQLERELSPRLRVPPPRTTSAPVLRRALSELIKSLERFNRHWATFLASVDLEPINRLRDGYNRYYVLEKEFAVRSARVARQGFVPLTPLTHDLLRQRLPSLPVPISATANV